MFARVGNSSRKLFLIIFEQDKHKRTIEHNIFFKTYVMSAAESIERIAIRPRAYRFAAELYAS